MAQEFVRQQLRSPSTAEFPYSTAPGVSSVAVPDSEGRCYYSVRLFVDAQNGFGGTVREKFSVELEPEGDSNTWNLRSITTY